MPKAACSLCRSRRERADDGKWMQGHMHAFLMSSFDVVRGLTSDTQVSGSWLSSPKTTEMDMESSAHMLTWLGFLSSRLTLAICFFSDETGILRLPGVGVSIHLWCSVSPMSLSEQAVSHTRSMSARTWPHITHLGPFPAVLAGAREPKLSQRPLFLAYSLSWQCVWGGEWEEADSYVTFS